MSRSTKNMLMLNRTVNQQNMKVCTNRWFTTQFVTSSSFNGISLTLCSFYRMFVAPTCGLRISVMLCRFYEKHSTFVWFTAFHWPSVSFTEILQHLRVVQDISLIHHRFYEKFLAPLCDCRHFTDAPLLLWKVYSTFLYLGRFLILCHFTESS